jgi:hypothetical protein
MAGYSNHVSIQVHHRGAFTFMPNCLRAVYVPVKNAQVEPPMDRDARDLIDNLYVHPICRKWGDVAPFSKFIGVVELLEHNCVWDGKYYPFAGKIRDAITVGLRVALDKPIGRLSQGNWGSDGCNSNWIDTDNHPEIHFALETLQKARCGDNG